jgi:hypothetical protein
MGRVGGTNSLAGTSAHGPSMFGPGGLGPGCLLLARLGSAWLRESIPLTGVKRTEMLRRGNACH